MSIELSNKLKMQKKLRNLKAFHKILENSTHVEDYVTSQLQTLSERNDPFYNGEIIHVNKDLHYLLVNDPAMNTTTVTELRSGDSQLIQTIEDNFFYQHMFNFALVVILLLQVIVVWAFIWCRLSKYGNQTTTPSNLDQVEDGIPMREMGEVLPEVIPQRHRLENNEGDQVNEGEGNLVFANRFGRYG